MQPEGDLSSSVSLSFSQTYTVTQALKKKRKEKGSFVDDFRQSSYENAVEREGATEAGSSSLSIVSSLLHPIQTTPRPTGDARQNVRGKDFFSPPPAPPPTLFLLAH